MASYPFEFAVTKSVTPVMSLKRFFNLVPLITPELSVALNSITFLQVMGYYVIFIFESHFTQPFGGIVTSYEVLAVNETDFEKDLDLVSVFVNLFEVLQVFVLP